MLRERRLPNRPSFALLRPSPPAQLNGKLARHKKIPGKWERKWKMAPGPKWPKNGHRHGKWTPEWYFWPFFHFVAISPILQISFEPGFGAYQGLAQKIKVPFFRIFSFFLQFRGFEGDFKTRAKPRYAPNSG